MRLCRQARGCDRGINRSIARPRCPGGGGQFQGGVGRQSRLFDLARAEIGAAWY